MKRGGPPSGTGGAIIASVGARVVCDFHSTFSDPAHSSSGKRTRRLDEGTPAEADEVSGERLGEALVHELRSGFERVERALHTSNTTQRSILKVLEKIAQPLAERKKPVVSVEKYAATLKRTVEDRKRLFRKFVYVEEKEIKMLLLTVVDFAPELDDLNMVELSMTPDEFKVWSALLSKLKSDFRTLRSTVVGKLAKAIEECVMRHSITSQSLSSKDWRFRQADNDDFGSDFLSDVLTTVRRSTTSSSIFERCGSLTVGMAAFIQLNIKLFLGNRTIGLVADDEKIRLFGVEKNIVSSYRSVNILREQDDEEIEEDYEEELEENSRAEEPQGEFDIGLIDECL
ncbi:hypothetical protein BSKO_02799 [Bryopsis sp. KO-2023]|nr:hypothetical protein BSKO_02799 [Bryopsis sp. KO-2023]